jgi:nucleotide-binding universal stress UspA family protein
MTFKTIVVNLNHEARVAELTAAAAAVARPTEAHVVGLYVMPPLFMPSDVVLPMGAEFYEQQIAEHKAQAARIKAIFDRLTSGEPFVAEWRCYGDAGSAYESIADGVVAQSRAAELMIVSQAADGVAPPMLTDIPERVAIESGRPVLVIPVTWNATAFGDKITVAWNNTKESTRAAFDALPFLRRASTIRLLTAGDQKDDDGASTIPAAEIAETLARHGFNVDVSMIDDAGRHAAPALIARVVADGSDMLVMGAYGHSRLREFILGGTTRDVLKTMTVPVLMSH